MVAMEVHETPDPEGSRRVVAQRGTPTDLERWVLPDRVYERVDHGTLAETRPFSREEHAWADGLVQAEEARAAAAERAEIIRQACEESAAYLERVASGEATAEDDRAQIVCLTRALEAIV